MLYDYIFLLGREPELSLAELHSLFPIVIEAGIFSYVTSDDDTILRIAPTLGGTIKIAKIIAKNLKKQEVLTEFTTEIIAHSQEGKKLRIALDSFIPGSGSVIFKAKEAVKKAGYSVRVVQHDGERVKTATTLHEKLTSQGLECVLIPDRSGGGYTLAKTLWVQDIDAYTKRDMERERSMVVGMMPPKIAQIMINLASKGDRELQIYDCFCGLGTTIIEAKNAGYAELLASDISVDMVKTTLINTEKIDPACEVFHHDARKIDEINIAKETVIVTEGMLGKNFTSGSISHTQILLERKDLTVLYTDFLASSWKNKSIQSVVFCLPFWNMGKETIFMPDISEIEGKWSLDNICKCKKRFLQHKRPAQSVGREIIVLRREKKSEYSLTKIK